MLPDYTRLDRLLTNQYWKEADLETRRLMLFISEADKRRDILLTESDIERFSCNHLETIDRLWLESSREKFGFSTINKIYRSVDSDYSKLAEIVGWKNETNWINYNQINFSDRAKVGHLPLTWVVPSTFSVYWSSRFAIAGWKRLLNRLESCQR